MVDCTTIGAENRDCRVRGIWRGFFGKGSFVDLDAGSVVWRVCEYSVKNTELSITASSTRSECSAFLQFPSNARLLFWGEDSRTSRNIRQSSPLISSVD